jgi:hypothetical protein
MKTFLVGIFAATILCAMALAQDMNPAPTNPGAAQPNPPETQALPPSAGPANGLHISPGSIIPVQLTKTIDAKKAKTGDVVEAKVTQDLKNHSGEVVVPKDTKVLGHITEAQPRSKEQAGSQVGITFDHAEVKDKGDVPLPLSIQAIIASPSSNSNAAAESAPSPGPGATPGNPGGMPVSSGRMSTASQPQVPTPGPSLDGSASGSASASGARQPITAKTEGVVGIADLKLAAASDSTQGWLLTSEKNNVKLESGTLMLLRVGQ